tara:strand:+ start:629 stop:1381 length:753 start_codon:yes stop_codon:yes gene_type:complete
MKLIKKFRSKNFDIRKSRGINCIIIHYTALNSCNEAIEYLCNPKNKVSSHYLISEKGEIYQLVSESKRAWHAGISYWKGIKDINSSSIGIELDYNPNKNKKYSIKLIESLIILLNKIKKKYKINSDCILGHSDVSPYRKKDPGYNFPWKILYIKKVISLENKLNKIDSKKIELYFKKKLLKTKKQKTLFMLDKIGYDIKPSKQSLKKYKILIGCYQNHFINFKKNLIYGKLDDFTYTSIKSQFNQFLTNN